LGSANAVNNNAINIQNINPIEKWIGALEENKKLYERLLQFEREKVEMLQRLLGEKNKLQSKINPLSHNCYIIVSLRTSLTITAKTIFPISDLISKFATM